jgi:UDP-2,3-diacylglucosamine pyrophosphatase LpxH
MDNTNHPRLYIVSDLHMCEGRDGRSGRYGRLEGFFYDEVFQSFIDACLEDTDQEPAVLILNGDVFDFLSVVRVPRRGDKGASFPVSSFEQKYGLLPSEEKAVWLLDRMVRGHKRFFRALLTWIKARQRVVLIRGNHDLELFWERVQRRLIELLVEIAAGMDEGPDAEEIQARLEFVDWFYHEPDRIYVEHGHQYESTNCITNLLHPVLPKNPFGGRESILDYPAGSYFLKIVYNRIRLIDPIDTHVLTYDEYTRLLNRAHFLNFLLVLYRNLPFLARMLKGFQPMEQNESRRIRKAHRERLDELAEASELGDRLREVDRLKARRSETTYAVGAALLKPIVFKGLLAFLAIVFSVGAYAALYTYITTAGAMHGYVFGTVFLSSVFGVLAFLALSFLIIYVSRKAEGGEHETVREYRVVGEQIGRSLGVRFVVNGHTHLPDYFRFSRSSVTVINSGSWTFVDTPANAIAPQSQMFTFVRVVGDKARLLRWNDGAGRFDPVVLLEPHERKGLGRVLGQGRV